MRKNDQSVPGKIPSEKNPEKARRIIGCCYCQVDEVYAQADKNHFVGAFGEYAVEDDSKDIMCSRRSLGAEPESVP